MQDFEGRSRHEFPDFFVRFAVPLHATAFFHAEALAGVQERCGAGLQLEAPSSDAEVEELSLCVSGGSASAVLNAAMVVFDTLAHPHVRWAVELRGVG